MNRKRGVQEAIITLVDSGRLAMDSSRDAEQQLVEQWRSMSAGRKLSASLRMSRTVRDLALAGIRARFPEAGPREQTLRLAVVMLGAELALAAYPEISSLDPW